VVKRIFTLAKIIVENKGEYAIDNVITVLALATLADMTQIGLALCGFWPRQVRLL
jgi:hypothetical protein